MATDESSKAGDIVFYALLVVLFVAGSVYAFLATGTSHEIALSGFSKQPLGVGQSWKTLGILIAAALTLALYSFLYKDNPFFKAAEHIFVGVALGYSLSLVWFLYLKSELYAPLIKYWVVDDVPGRPDYVLVVPMILGLFLLARFVKPIAWLSRWSFAFIVGFGSGIAIPAYIKAFILKQLEYTILPISPLDAPLEAFGTLFILAGVISVLIYFYFSMEHTGVVGGISRVGIWFLMVAFGASFGYTVMGRMALLVGRMQFLIGDWLQLGAG
ncbi:hypothetical protein ACFL59_07385 [Planctomycetota bacterium]